MVTMDKSEPGSIHTYLTQMGNVPLLSRSEELATARQIHKTRGRLRRALLSSVAGNPSRLAPTFGADRGNQQRA